MGATITTESMDPLSDASATLDCQGVALYTSAPSLQAEVLSSVLAQHLSLPSKILETVDSTMANELKNRLLLVDCQGQSVSQLRAILSAAHQLLSLIHI